MTKLTSSIIGLAIILQISYFVDAKNGVGSGQQDWGYVQVRPGAHMFWWLYNAEVSNYQDKPLIVYLQGGPGSSATGFGNFIEIGPLDENMTKRNRSWVNDYNVLFVDSPVGTGFSYVEKSEQLATTNTQIVKDLMKVISEFYEGHAIFQSVPVYIFSESYGGKVAVELALQWYKDQESKTIKSDLRGVGLGNPWISPIDTILSWPSYLLQMGFIDTDGAAKINEAVMLTKQAVEGGRWSEATDLFIETAKTARAESKGVNLYNWLTPVGTRKMEHAMRSLKTKEPVVPTVDGDDEIGTPRLHELMNNEVKPILNSPVQWVAFNRTVFDTLKSEFMKPVTSIVEQLLDETKLKVAVYTSQLDFIVDTPGTLHWAEKLNWKESAKWRTSRREALVANGIIEGFYKTFDRFRFYWVNRAGHQVQSDNPTAMSMILKDMAS